MDTKSIYIDFFVSSDLYNLVINDTSCWGLAETKPAVIEITFPGSKKPISKYFPKKTTVYDSNSLGVTCGDECDLVELPDGIYNIKLKASPQSFYKEVRYAKLDQLRQVLDAAYVIALDDECKSCKKEELLTLEFKKLQIEALVRRGDIKRAQSIYDGVKKIADKLSNCENC